MPQSVTAIYEDGILRPLAPLRGVSEHSEVRLIVREPSLSPQQLAECLSILPLEDTEEMIRAIEEGFERTEEDPSNLLAGELGAKRASFLRLVASLTDLEQLKPGWNTYEAAPPSTSALGRALRVLRVLHSVDFLPHRVLPLADGGVALVFSKGPLIASFECFNDGEITAGLSDRSDHHDAWDLGLDGVEAAVERIRAFLNA